MRLQILEKTVAIGAIVLACFAACCHVNWSRFEDERAVTETRAIRDAERVFKQKTGRFGSIDDLAGENLIDFKPGTGLTSRYIFECTADSDTYRLTVRERPGSATDKDPSEVFTMYADESGVITVSFKPNEPADRDSFPLHDQ